MVGEGKTKKISLFPKSKASIFWFLGGDSFDRREKEGPIYYSTAQKEKRNN
jgi:hypothetical protein